MLPTTVLLAAMQTTSWEVRIHYFNSLERFYLAKAVRNLKCMMLLQLLNFAGCTDSRGFTIFWSSYFNDVLKKVASAC